MTIQLPARLRFTGKALLLLLTCLMIFSSLDAQPSKRKQKSLLKKAKEHLGYEEFQEAIPHIQELLGQDPANAHYNFWMGKALYLTYKKNQALPYFDKTDEINPQVSEEFHYYYALCLHYNLEFDRAISEYRLDLERYAPNSVEYKEINNRISQCMYAQKMRKRKEGDLVKIDNMGGSINSEYAEHSPVISANDSVLVYTARRPESLGADPEGYYYDEDVYVATREGEGWTQGRNIGTPVNSKGHDATISLTADGQRLYIYRHKRDGGLYVTDFDQEVKKWKEPKSMGKPLNSKYYEASICQSADGNKLFFSSDRPGGYGGRDIYMVEREGEDRWTEPVNLGPAINTAFDEDAPFFHPDGRTLYFSSNGAKSIGGWDVFVTEYVEESDQWLPPLNMGTPINTPDDEIYFVLSADGLTGYYSSGKEGGFGEKDIYQIKFPYFRYPKRYYAIEVVGVVQDVESLDTLDAMIRLIDKEDGLVVDSMETTTAQAFYKFELEPERAYTLEVVADGFTAGKDSLVTPPARDDDVYMRRDILVRKPVITEAPKAVPEIQHIYFDFDKSDLRTDAEEELQLVADIMLENQELSVEILGHTDWYGTYDYNVALSERRSQAAYNYLLQQGINRDRIEQNWYSENKPIENNSSDLGRQYNRRTEFRFFNRNGDMVLSSVRLKKGGEAPWVDHAEPQGLPGFDNPEAGPLLSAVSANAAPPREEEGRLDPVDDQPSERLKGEVGGERLSGKDNFESFSSDDFEDFDNPAGIEGYTLQNIYFDFDKSYLRGASRVELDKIAEILEMDPNYKVSIKGHTDNYGSLTYNQTLSEMRCNAARMYLLEEKGIPASRIQIEGFSELQPISDNGNSGGRQNNRRVEFVIHKDGLPVLQSQQ